MAKLDMETEEILKSAGLSTKEPDDVLAPQEPQVTEMGRPVQMQARSPQIVPEKSIMGLGVTPDAEEAYKGYLIQDPFTESLAALGVSVAYGQIISSRVNTELAVTGNAAIHGVSSFLSFRAMLNPAATPFQKLVSAVTGTFLGIASVGSVVETVTATPKRKLKPITIPKIFKKAVE